MKGAPCLLRERSNKAPTASSVRVENRPFPASDAGPEYAAARRRPTRDDYTEVGYSARNVPCSSGYRKGGIEHSSARSVGWLGGRRALEPAAECSAKRLREAADRDEKHRDCNNSPRARDRPGRGGRASSELGKKGRAETFDKFLIHYAEKSTSLTDSQIWKFSMRTNHVPITSENAILIAIYY